MDQKSHLLYHQALQDHYHILGSARVKPDQFHQNGVGERNDRMKFLVLFFHHFYMLQTHFLLNSKPLEGADRSPQQQLEVMGHIPLQTEYEHQNPVALTFLPYQVYREYLQLSFPMHVSYQNLQPARVDLQFVLFPQQLNLLTLDP